MFIYHNCLRKGHDLSIIGKIWMIQIDDITKKKFKSTNIRLSGSNRKFV